MILLPNVTGCASYVTTFAQLSCSISLHIQKSMTIQIKSKVMLTITSPNAKSFVDAFVSMYVYVCMHAYVHIHVCIYVCLSACINMRIDVMHVHACIYACAR